MKEKKASKEKTAFVLAGGGSLGAIQAGMLKALADRGIRPDLIVGASVGAINGAFFAQEPTPKGAAALTEIWQGLKRPDVFPLSAMEGAKAFLALSNNLVNPSHLRRLIRKHLAVSNLEDLPVPFCAVATDFLSGSEVCIKSGPALPALMASAAIPAVFPPVLLGGRNLIDGGVAAMTPVAAAADMGATRVIVLHTGYSCAMSELPAGGLIAMGLHILNVMVTRKLAEDIERLMNKVEIFFLPPLCPMEASPFDFSQTARLMGKAEESTGAWLDLGSLEKKANPMAYLAHRH
ncbi:MAG: patatin-like phospholipase family protein [Thermodesulfobacteriota bacterium]